MQTTTTTKTTTTANNNLCECILVKSIACPAPLTDLSIPKSAVIYKDLVDNRFFSSSNDLQQQQQQQQQILFIIASFQNGTCSFIDLQNFNQFSLPTLQLESWDDNECRNHENEQPARKLLRKSSSNSSSRSGGGSGQEYFLSIDQSFSGLLGIGLTSSSNLVAFRNLQFNQQLIPLLNLYEYHLMSGYDHTDLLLNTSPRLVESVAEKLAELYHMQLKSLQKMLFNRFNAIIFTLLNRRCFSFSSLSSANAAAAHPQLDQFRSFDLLIRLIVNKSNLILSYAVQLVLSVEQVKKQLLEDQSASSLSVSHVMSNMDLINQSVLSPTSNSNNNKSNLFLTQIPFKNNLYEYFADLLSSSNLRQIQLNEIVQLILNKRNYQLFLNQQVRHVFQFLLDLSLYLTNVIIVAKSGRSATAATAATADKNCYHCGLGLLSDAWFVKEMLKFLIYIKLVFAFASSLSLGQPHQSLVAASLAVLPLRSSMQKDLLTDLYNIYIKILFRVDEGKYQQKMSFRPIVFINHTCFKF